MAPIAALDIFITHDMGQATSAAAYVLQSAAATLSLDLLTVFSTTPDSSGEPHSSSRHATPYHIGKDCHSRILP